MPRTLEVRVIQDSIRNQVRVSQEIFKQIGNLANIAEHYHNDALTQDLKNVMQSLLVIGKGLSENARVTGEKVLNLVETEAG